MRHSRRLAKKLGISTKLIDQAEAQHWGALVFSLAMARDMILKGKPFKKSCAAYMSWMLKSYKNKGKRAFADWDESGIALNRFMGELSKLDTLHDRAGAAAEDKDEAEEPKDTSASTNGTPKTVTPQPEVTLTEAMLRDNLEPEDAEQAVKFVNMSEDEIDDRDDDVVMELGSAIAVYLGHEAQRAWERQFANIYQHAQKQRLSRMAVCDNGWY